MKKSGTSGLTLQNFVQNGKELLLNTRGNFLVLFYSNGEKNCENFKPYFSKLAKEFPSIHYASYDIQRENNKNLISISRKTTTPIQSVPFLIFYVGGRPKLTIPPKNDTRVMASIITEFLQGSLSAVVDYVLSTE